MATSCWGFLCHRNIETNVYFNHGKETLYSNFNVDNIFLNTWSMVEKELKIA